jgi:hypothetical protein
MLFRERYRVCFNYKGKRLKNDGKASRGRSWDESVKYEKAI